MRYAGNKTSHARGFTLIELLIVVVIVGVLLMVALPGWERQVLRSNRAAAQAEMMEISNRQQQYLLDNRAYATKAQVEAVYTVDPAVLGNYDWAITLGGGALPTFVITFDPKGRQEKDGGNRDLTLNQAGVRGPADLWK